MPIRRIGFLSGDTPLYQRLTPREILLYFGRLYGMDEARLRDRVEALVRDLEMAEFSRRPASTLSAGQKQRANIARAFLQERPVLILDEPTTALDILSGRRGGTRLARTTGRVNGHVRVDGHDPRSAARGRRFTARRGSLLHS